MISKFYITFSLLCFLVTIASAAVFSQERERIISYHSEIIVHQNGSMDVEESIEVYCLGIEIRRGIFRDFPTDYKDIYGNNVIVNFELVETLRDGNTEASHIESISNGIRIYMGSENIFLTPNKSYVYKIKYKTSRQLGFFTNHDELYWNVTGTGWAFKIEKATANISLPVGISKDDIKYYAYTGTSGERGRNYTAGIQNNSIIKFSTRSALMPHEGLSIVVEWPKGFVTEPTAADRFSYFISDNSSLIAALIGLALLILYYVLFWFKVGKDPEKATIIPVFKPPDNFTPAAMHYIMKMGYDSKCFAASILNLAVKKQLVINENDDSYTLISRYSTKEILIKEEINVLTALKLTSKGNQLELKNTNHSKIKKGIDALKSELKSEYEKIYFITNRKYFVIGLIFSLLIVVITAVFSSAPEVGIIVWLSVWSIGVSFLLFTVFKSWVDVFKRGRKKAASIGGAIFITLFSIPFVAGEIVGFVMLGMQGSPWTIILIALIGVINIVFFHLLKAPTLLGRKVMDKIEGFKMYLAIAEKDRLNQNHPIEKTPELFEKYLPYAFALGVEQQWAEQFESVLSSVGEDGKTYSPSFYSGTAWTTFGAGSFASSFSGSFSSAVSSSSTAPGSSSGSGGSSGGGGGGGGGGGW